MGASFTIQSMPTFRDLKGRYAKATEGLLNDRRDMMRVQGRRFVDYAKDEAPKRDGKFAKKIIFRTFADGSAIGFNVYVPQPLGTWILQGTKPHIIRAKNASTLAFHWDKGPKGPGMYFYPQVNHPGTKPNKFMGRAYRRWLPGARADLHRISDNYVRTIQGSK